MEKGAKPLGHKSYESIPHLPGSKRGPADRGVEGGQARIATEKTRDFKDLVIIQEKLDGSNVSVARINGEIVFLTRAGYTAESSPYEQHHQFHKWAGVQHKYGRWEWIREGERLCAEWLIMPHGTVYKDHTLFVAFDIMRNRHERATYAELLYRCGNTDIVTPNLIHMGGPAKPKWITKKLGMGKHGAQEKPEGAVWRIEREGKVDFLCKFIRHDFVPGKYIPELNTSSHG